MIKRKTKNAMLTLVCYNIHWCVGTDNQYDPTAQMRYRRSKRRQHTDIVCLQEVHQYTSAFPHDDQASVLAQFLGFNYMCFGATMTGSPKSKDDVGHYGNAIISRYPLTFLGTLPFNNDRQKNRARHWQCASIVHWEMSMSLRCIWMYL